MAGSTNAIDVKAQILAMIRDIPEAEAEDWDIDWGFSKSPERTWVYCGEINWDSSEWATNRSREEVFNVRVVVNIKRRRGTPEDLEREVVRIGALIEAGVKAAPQFGMGEVVTSGFIPRKMDSMPADEYGEAQLEADIRVVARF